MSTPLDALQHFVTGESAKSHAVSGIEQIVSNGVPTLCAGQIACVDQATAHTPTSSLNALPATDSRAIAPPVLTLTTANPNSTRAIAFYANTRSILRV